MTTASPAAVMPALACAWHIRACRGPARKPAAAPIGTGRDFLGKQGGEGPTPTTG